MMYNKSDLKSRGWTEALIASFLPVPTKEKPNPRYKSAATMKLYDQSKVHAIEANEQFQMAKGMAMRRSAGAKAATKKGRERTKEWVKSLPPPEIPVIPEGRLRALAVDSYNDLWADRGNLDKYATTGDNPEFLNRICVNYLRHEVSDYEENLLEAFGRVGADHARARIRRKVLAAIARAYPDLAKECQRQANGMNAKTEW